MASRHGGLSTDRATLGPIREGAPMTDNVIRFPARPERNWREIEQAVDEFLLRTPLDGKSRGRIKERLKDFYGVLGRWHEAPLSGDITIPGFLTAEQFQVLSNAISTQIIQRNYEFLKAFAYELIIERLKREIEMEIADIS
jgi:hypothetical protein